MNSSAYCLFRGKTLAWRDMHPRKHKQQREKGPYSLTVVRGDDMLSVACDELSEYIRQNPRCTVNDIWLAFSYVESSVKRVLRKLTEDGRVCAARVADGTWVYAEPGQC